MTTEDVDVGRARVSETGAFRKLSDRLDANAAGRQASSDPAEKE